MVHTRDTRFEQLIYRHQNWRVNQVDTVTVGPGYRECIAVTGTVSLP